MDFLNDATNWVALSFLIFAVIFAKVGWGKVTAMLDARIADIASELESAEKLHREAAELLQDYQNRQRDALKEAAEITARAQQQAEIIRAKAEADLQDTMARREKQLVERLERLEKSAEAEIRLVTAQLAIKASDAVIRKSLDGKAQSALVDHAIKSLDAA